MKIELPFTYRAVFSGETSVNDKADILLIKLYFVGFTDLFPHVLSRGRLEKHENNARTNKKRRSLASLRSNKYFSSKANKAHVFCT